MVFQNALSEQITKVYGSTEYVVVDEQRKSPFKLFNREEEMGGEKWHLPGGEERR